MRSVALSAAAGLWLALLANSSVAGKPVAKPKTEEACGSYGTSVDFVATPKEAAKQAEKEQKLVFIVHVSGNFEDPNLT